MINCDRDCLNCLYAECMVDEHSEEVVNRKKKINEGKRKYTRIMLNNSSYDHDEYRIPNRYYYDY